MLNTKNNDTIILSLSQKDILSLMNIVKDKMSLTDRYGYKFCTFCNKPSYMGDIVHLETCRGSSLLRLFERTTQKPFYSLLKISDLFCLPTIQFSEGMSAIRWLLDRKNHNLTSRVLLLTIRKIKQKMGLPI